MISGHSALFTKGTGRWFGAFCLILVLTIFLDNSPSEAMLHGETFLLLGITFGIIINNFWSYGATPSLMKRIPLTYKEDIFYTVIWFPLCCLIFIAVIFLFGAVGGCVNLILGETTIDAVREEIINFFHAPHNSLLYQISMVLFMYGTFYPLSFTVSKRLFWTTALCFTGTFILYNIGMSLLLNGGIWNFDFFLTQLDQKPAGLRVSLLSLGISVLYAIGGILAALKLHRPKKYDNI